MKINVGRLDKSMRLGFGTIFLLLAIILPGYFKLISLLGMILLTTALVQRCPLYTFFGWSSCPITKVK